MFRSLQRRVILICFLLVFFLIALQVLNSSRLQTRAGSGPHPDQQPILNPDFRWKDRPQQHPVHNLTPLPIGVSAPIPAIQHRFGPEDPVHATERKQRQAAVEEAFRHTWEGYQKHAWLQDEVGPLSGLGKTTFGGWGATMVDTLDTLWIMGMKKEFAVAVSELKKIDFTLPDLDTLNIFETTIRYLGGLLAAYDLSGHQYDILLEKAVQLGEMLYAAFDTHNRLPVTRWDWANTASGKDQQALGWSLLAEIGSFSLEFTRLSQLTGNNKWYDAVARLTDALEESQNRTKVPGLWPVLLDTGTPDFTRDITFTWGGMADSTYEYLPKQHLMIAGQSEQYRTMYNTALQAAKKYILFQPYNVKSQKMLLAGTLRRHSAGRVMLDPQAEHLACFAGGMVALASKVFSQPDDLATARELVDGCLWAYASMPTGIMPELFQAIPCRYDAYAEGCPWTEQVWHDAILSLVDPAKISGSREEYVRETIELNRLAPGFADIPDARYILRPEAIESVFVMYRITGEQYYQDQAWQMFQSITNLTRTPIGFASVQDVTAKDSQLLDLMESFWTAETLKYFYLIFSEPDVVSLDRYVLNTEAHPLLRPT